MAIRTRKDIMNRLKDDTLDMSYCDLVEVPVQKIACIPRAKNINLSYNQLTSLSTSFATLQQIVVLDLSKNKLVELPENFGLLKNLKHLDLYGNQISRLPLSLGDLKNLKWLDLKENPLAEAVALIAGPCNNMEECHACARNVVNYLSIAKCLVEEQILSRLNNQTDEAENKSTTRKEIKKKKKKKKECKMDDNKTESQASDSSAALASRFNSNGEEALKESISSDIRISELHEPGRTCCPYSWLPKCFYLMVVIMILILICSVTSSMFLFEHFDTVLSKLPLRDYHIHTKDMLDSMMNITTIQINSITNMVNDFIEMYFKREM